LPRQLCPYNCLQIGMHSCSSSTEERPTEGEAEEEVAGVGVAEAELSAMV